MATEYEYEPFEGFIRRRDEITKIVYVSCYALMHLEGAGKLASVLDRPARDLEHIETVEREALEEAQAGFPLMHATGAVLLWAALESAIRDMLVRWLTKHRKALLSKEVTNIRIKIGEYECMSDQDRMRYVIGVVEREVGSALQPGIGRFTGLLHAFGINPTCDDTLRRDLLELASLRHCIAHSSGIADQKLVERCPWLPWGQGDRISIGRDDFLRYSKAASSYAANSIVAAREAGSKLAQ